MNFDGAIRSSEELGKLSLASLCGLLKLVKPKEVSLTVTADLRSKEFTSGDKCMLRLVGPRLVEGPAVRTSPQKYDWRRLPVCRAAGNNSRGASPST